MVDLKTRTDTIVEGGVTILGHTTIGHNNVITQGSRIEDSQIGDDNVITASHIESAVLADRTKSDLMLTYDQRLN